MFQKMRFFKKNAVKLPSRKNQKSFGFLIKCFMQVTNKLKFVEKQLYRKQYVPKVRFYHFSKRNRMTIKSLKIAVKIIFISREIIPYNQKKKKMPIQHENSCRLMSSECWS